MAKTKIEDILVPDVWESYFIERTAELANFGESGLAERSEAFDALANGPGRTIDMPFWKDLSSGRQIVSDTAALSTRKITASGDAARIHNDANAWSATLLAELLAGDDPMEAIAELVAEYWARVDEGMLIATVKGAMGKLATESGSPNVLNIAAESIALTGVGNVLSDITFLDAIQKLGDVKDRLVALGIHSMTENDLNKQNQIEFIPGSEGDAMIRAFKGLQVIMDDDLPVRVGSTNGSVFTTVIFGRGAIARGFGSLDTPLDNGFGTEAVEFARVSLNHDNVLINRRRHIMHPRGVKWLNETVAGDGGPTDAELENVANWNRVFEAKNIRIVTVDHNLVGQIDSES